MNAPAYLLQNPRLSLPSLLHCFDADGTLPLPALLIAVASARAPFSKGEVGNLAGKRFASSEFTPDCSMRFYLLSHNREGGGEELAQPVRGVYGSSPLLAPRTYGSTNLLAYGAIGKSFA